jgi:hypothetical protein
MQPLVKRTAFRAYVLVYLALLILVIVTFFLILIALRVSGIIIC